MYIRTWFPVPVLKYLLDFSLNIKFMLSKQRLIKKIKWQSLYLLYSIFTCSSTKFGWKTVPLF